MNVKARVGEAGFEFEVQMSTDLILKLECWRSGWRSEGKELSMLRRKGWF